MINYAAEAVGTTMLILFGDGVVANVLLARSKGENSGWIVITFGWAVAVTVAVYAVGRLSGAHLNPAVTLALASMGAFPWADVPGYIGAQMIGAIAGAVLVWLMYLAHWPITQDANRKLAVFCTGPSVSNPAANFVTEAIATAAFVFAVLAIGANAQMLSKPGDLDLSVVFSSGLQPLLIGGLVLGVGLSFGGPTGYAINPARDLGPRIAHFLLPIPGKRDSDWGYSWIPIVGPIVGGVIGAQIFRVVGF
jgi:glycerol uptake facilitator protein